MKHAQRIMKPLSIAIASLSASALAQNSGFTSPFATIPLNNQHITQTSDTYVESWQMTLDVRTGSNPKLNNSYLSGFDKNVDGKGNKMPIAGLQQVRAVSGVNIVSTNKVPSSINPNGGGESGEDGLNPGRKDCVTRDEWYTMIAVQDGIHFNKLTVPLCASNNRLVRINLREVR